MLQNLFHWRWFKGTVVIILTAFVSIIPAQSGYAQVVSPMPGQMAHVTGVFSPARMVGMRMDFKDPFNFYFVMNKGEQPLASDTKKAEYNKLIKYFLASLTTPNKDMWVNLSPIESNRIIPDNFAQTEMGRDLLAQDYLLKQLTSSLMYPEDQVGKEFWAKVYTKAFKQFGTTDIPMDTFNKVWIMADKADIYQKDDTVLLVDSHLKVMLQQDFMAIESNKEQFGDIKDDQAGGNEAARKLASDIVRDVIVPIIEKEINTGSSFAQVRQIYNSMILATWFKKTLKKSLLGQVYADKSKVAGIEVNDPKAKEKIYEQYLQAYKVGVFNYIKDDINPVTQETLPRKYFSGGTAPVDLAMIQQVDAADAAQKLKDSSMLSDVVNTWFRQATLAAVLVLSGPTLALADHPTPKTLDEIATETRQLLADQNVLTEDQQENKYAAEQLAQQMADFIQQQKNIESSITRTAPIAPTTATDLLTTETPAASLTTDDSLTAQTTRITNNNNRWLGLTTIGLIAGFGRALIYSLLFNLRVSIRSKKEKIHNPIAETSPAKPKRQQRHFSNEELGHIQTAVAIIGERTNLSTREDLTALLQSILDSKTPYERLSSEITITQESLARLRKTIKEQRSKIKELTYNILMSRLYEIDQDTSNNKDYIPLIDIFADNQPLTNEGLIKIKQFIKNKNYPELRTSIQQFENAGLRWFSQKKRLEQQQTVTFLINQIVRNPRLSFANGRAALLYFFSLSPRERLDILISIQLQANLKTSRLLQEQTALEELTHWINPRKPTTPYLREQIERRQTNLSNALEAIETKISLQKDSWITKLAPMLTAMQNALPADAAALQAPYGGINFDEKNLAMNIRVDGDGMPLPANMQDPAMLNMEGLAPIIRKIEPITPANMPVLSELTRSSARP